MRCPYSCCLALILLAAGLLPTAAAAQAPDAAAAWTAVNQPAFDPQKVAAVSNVKLQRDLAEITLASGSLGLAQPINGKVLFAAFRGKGAFRLAPALATERQQLRFFTGKEALEIEFAEALFFFSDSTVDELSTQTQFVTGDAASLEKSFADRRKKLAEFGLGWEARLLHAALSENPAPFAFFHAELKTEKYGWLSFDFDQGEIEELQLARWSNNFRSLNYWCRFPAGGRTPMEAFREPNARDAYALRGYKLYTAVDEKPRLTGWAEVRLTSRLAGQRVLLFSLSPNLQVSSVKDSSGAALAYFQPADPKDRIYYGDYVAVVLPQPTTAGQDLTLRFDYSGERVVTKEGSGVFFARSFGWYPSYGMGKVTLHNPEFSQRYDFDITLEVPKKYDAVATGAKVDEREEGKSKITRWTSANVPLAVAGFAFGSYYIHEKKLDSGATVQVFVNRNPDQYLQSIRNEASQAQDIGGGGSPTGPAATGAGGLGGPDPRLAILETLNPARFGPVMLTEVANSLQVFEQYFGPYPYSKLAVSNIPWGYGQGWPGLLYVSSVTFLDSTQRFTLFGRVSSEDQTRMTDFFRAHETSHQWWGHVVGWKSYRDQWLSEGFAEFSGILYTQFRSGPPEAVALLRRNRDDLINKDREGAVIDEIGPIYLGQRLSSEKHPGTYGVTVYGKGGWVLHMLRTMMMDFNSKEPEARFQAMMKEFTRTYYNQAASTDDFKRIAEKYMTPAMNVDGSGKLDWFFNQWVYGTGIPRYTVKYSITPQGSGVRLQGIIRQSGVPENFVMPVPIYAYAGPRAQRLGWVTVRGAETPFDIELPMKIDKIGIDEWADVLCTVDYQR
ncbi:MAG TPA: M1 family aminopeptidase [Candidatus Xenobia bacterium]|nr:M1 family aminopeptidase [Candidatus Xenobia bacterium]